MPAPGKRAVVASRILIKAREIRCGRTMYLAVSRKPIMGEGTSDQVSTTSRRPRPRRHYFRPWTVEPATVARTTGGSTMHDSDSDSSHPSANDKTPDPPATTYRGRPRIAVVPIVDVRPVVPVDAGVDIEREPPADEAPAKELPDITTLPVGRLRRNNSNAEAFVVTDGSSAAADAGTDDDPIAITITPSDRSAASASMSARNAASQPDVPDPATAAGRRKQRSQTELMIVWGGLATFAIVAVIGLAAMSGGDSGSEESNDSEYEVYDADRQTNEHRASRRQPVESEEFKRSRARRQAWTAGTGGDFIPEENPPVNPADDEDASVDPAENSHEPSAADQPFEKK